MGYRVSVRVSSIHREKKINNVGQPTGRVSPHLFEKMVDIPFKLHIYKVPLRPLRGVPKGVAQERSPNIQHLTVGKFVELTDDVLENYL